MGIEIQRVDKPSVRPCQTAAPISVVRRTAPPAAPGASWFCCPCTGTSFKSVLMKEMYLSSAKANTSLPAGLSKKGSLTISFLRGRMEKFDVTDICRQKLAEAGGKKFGENSVSSLDAEQSIVYHGIGDICLFLRNCLHNNTVERRQGRVRKTMIRLT